MGGGISIRRAPQKTTAFLEKVLDSLEDDGPALLLIHVCPRGTPGWGLAPVPLGIPPGQAFATQSPILRTQVGHPRGPEVHKRRDFK
jgi:hypothetical protein